MEFSLPLLDTSIDEQEEDLGEEEEVAELGMAAVLTPIFFKEHSSVTEMEREKAGRGAASKRERERERVRRWKH